MNKLGTLRLPLLNFIHIVLLLAIAATIYLFVARFPIHADLTQTASNSLEPGSVDVLQQLHGPVKLTVFISEQDARNGDLRKLIRQFVELYQRYKSDISLDFIDPVKYPDVAQQADIQNTGEMVVEHDGRREHLTMLNEQALTNALLALAHRKDQLLMYVTGHGERKLDGIANNDLGDFGKRLTALGFHISALNLALAQEVPDNVNLLVITQPQTDWLPGELDKLMRFVARGGNVFWLLDAGNLHGLERLAQTLGLVLTPGIVIDPDAEEMRAPANWALGANYPPHAITHSFNLITAFPFSRALKSEDRKDWKYRTLVEAAPHGWVSTSTPKGKPHFDQSRDTPGPAAIALALQRNIKEREQRIVVIGSGAFLANTYVGNGGNLDLGINMVNWLSQQERLITLAPRAAKDNTLTFSKTQLAVISIGTVIVLPLVLLLVGGWLWWRRRR